MKKFSAKDCEEMIKKGKTLAYAAEMVEAKDVEEFIDRIRTIFEKKGANDILRRFKKNEKKKISKKGKKSNVEVISSNESIIIPDKINEDLASGELIGPALMISSSSLINEEIDIDESNNEVTVPEIASQMQLDSLITQKKEIETELCKSEATIKNLQSKSRNIRLDLMSDQNELHSIIAKVRTLQELVYTKIIKLKEIDKEIQSEKSFLAEGKEILSIIESEIKELSKIIIYIYNDSFDAEYNFEKINEENFTFQEMLKTLVLKSELETFSIKTIKNLLSLTIQLSKLEELNITYDLIFDNKDLEIAFQTISNLPT